MQGFTATAGVGATSDGRSPIGKTAARCDFAANSAGGIAGMLARLDLGPGPPAGGPVRCRDWPASGSPARRAALRDAGRRPRPRGWRPRRVMLRATIVGSPSSSTWLSRYRFRSRLLASTMERTASTGGVSSSRPSEDLDRHDLVPRAGRKAVQAGEIGEREPPAGKLALSGPFFDGYARDNCRPFGASRPGG